MKILKSVTLISRSLMWVMMVKHKTSDQYLTSGKVSIRSSWSFRRYRPPKTFNLKFQSLTSRSPMWVMMVQHKTSDQYLTSGKVSTRSIHRFKRYRLLKKNFNILSNADVTAMALPVLAYRGAKNEGTNKQQQPDSCIHDKSTHCPHVYKVSIS